MNHISSITQSPVYGRRIEEAEAKRTGQGAQAEQEKQQAKAEPAAEYVPGEETAASGLYRLSRDEEGNPKILYDDPAKRKDKTEGDMAKPADGDGGEENTTVNTDRVDQEIRDLKEKKSKLDQQIARAKENPEKQAQLERQLEQVEGELREKDTDSYRRQHAESTEAGNGGAGSIF